MEAEASRPDLWEDPARAQRLLSELGDLRETLETVDELGRKLEDAEILLELLREEEDPELAQEFEGIVRSLEEALERFELRLLLTGPYDARNAIVEIHPGAGGTEAQDWAEMLYRMYTRWAEDHGYGVEVLDLLPGDEAGIKSVTFLVKGRYAYGRLLSERGVHRLVRISPFDASGRRHTSFASVNVLPEIEEDVEVHIRPEDLRIETFRASGAGGQYVNMTDSAGGVRHVHILSTRSARAERLDAQVFGTDVYLHILLDLGEDIHGSERRVPPSGSVKRRYAHETMHAAFGKKAAIGVSSLHEKRDALDSRLVSRKEVEDFHAVPMVLGPAGVHPVEHLCPILSLGTTGSGVDFHDRVARVVRPGEEETKFEALERLLKGANDPLELLSELWIFLFPKELEQNLRVFQLPPQLVHRL